ncbi:hypothetical protein AB0I16_35160 [Streptomyces sp. NPDC050703]|uniref:hypothetical protein n=1 Tax=Streptomyces sp. NPDC050703 TaxID=3157218 RepID=UPI0034416890
MVAKLGFEELLGDDRFFPRLLAHNAHSRMSAPAYGPDLPVVLLTGGPGMGKRQLLEELRDRFGAKAPVALVDCADPQYEREAGERPSCRSAATETLYDIAQRMEEWDGPGGAVPTPRFFAGMAAVAAVAAGQGLRQQELDEELTRYRRLLHAPRSRGIRVFRNVAHGYLVALAAIVAPAAAMPLVGAALTEFLETLVARGDEPVQGTYRNYPGAAGSAATGLRLLGKSFRRDAEGRRFAEGFLFRALREDVAAAYSGAGARLKRVGRPAILLQHSNWPVGRALLAAALDDWADGHRGRTVLVASERMAEPLFLAGEQRTEELAVYRPGEQAAPEKWERMPARGQLGQAVLLLRMPPLTSGQVKQRVLEEAGAADNEGLLFRAQGAVRRLSGHRPRMVQRLAEAAANLPRLDNDRDLLAHRVVLDGAPAPVRDVLLEELVLRQPPERLPVGHTGRWLDLLTHLSVAHTGDCARKLLRSGELEQLAGGLTADQVQQYLQESGWPACERHFIGDFGLRQLLMCRLYGTPGTTPATPGTTPSTPGATTPATDWHRNHSLLYAHYRALPEAPDRAFGTTAAHGLNHDLVAGGGPERAIRHLAAEFPATGTRAEEWCEQLLAIAQAPLLGGPDPRHARMNVAEIVGTTLERRLDQLLHAVWLCEERTRPPDAAAAEKMAELLGDLALAYPEPAPVLADRAGTWGKRAGGKRPLQPCACTSHISQGS